MRLFSPSFNFSPEWVTQQEPSFRYWTALINVQKLSTMQQGNSRENSPMRDGGAGLHPSPWLGPDGTIEKDLTFFDFPQENDKDRFQDPFQCETLPAGRERQAPLLEPAAVPLSFPAS
jgi:hypothetical protein